MIDCFPGLALAVLVALTVGWINGRRNQARVNELLAAPPASPDEGMENEEPASEGWRR